MRDTRRARFRRGERDARAPELGRPPRIGSAITRFMVGSVLAIAVVVVGGYLALRSVATDQAVRDTRERVQSAGRLIESAGLSDDLLRGDPRAIRTLDRIVRGSVLTGPVVRVKIWSRDGTVLYSDEPALIGRRYTLAPDDLELFESTSVAAELSDVKRPENRFERGEGELLEAYSVVHTPGGTPLLFEIYQRFSAVTADGHRLLRAEAPPLLGGLLVLLLFQLPLAWSLGRRLQRGHRDRAALLANAVEASAQERRRIASDLHDGVVQNVAGVAFGLAPLAHAAERRGDEGEAGELRRSIAQLRQGVHDMRTLLVEIHPPNLEAVGLEAALHDLLVPLESRGMDTTLHVDAAAATGDPGDALLYRVAREAIRNAVAHGGPSAVHVAVSRPNPATTRLVVSDDGRGFDAADRERAQTDGHVGLTLLEGLVEQAGGRLQIASRPGAGATIVLELPCRPDPGSGGDGRPRRAPQPVVVPAGEHEVGGADLEVVAK